jgi:hypothetical protein
MSTDKRDANEAELVEVWRMAGSLWIPMSRDAGFDGVLVDCGRVMIVEVKNPARKWQLSDAEKRRKAMVEEAGGVYHIVQTIDDARGLTHGR